MSYQILRMHVTIHLLSAKQTTFASVKLHFLDCNYVIKPSKDLKSQGHCTVRSTFIRR